MAATPWRSPAKRTGSCSREKFSGSEVTYRFECLDFQAGDRKFNAFYTEFPKNPPARARSHEHEGAEFIYVLSGSLAVKIGDTETLLRKEDALYFDSTGPIIIGHLATHYARQWS
jgi:quercetin dioxygenase-like cupin family protein